MSDDDLVLRGTDEDSDGDGADDGILEIETWQGVRLPLPEGKWKRNTRRNLAYVTTVVIHQSAVSGGFGVSERLLAQHDGDALAARQERLRATPYAGIYSPQDAASLIQWPAWAYMHHGNRSNSYSVGWAYDGKIPGDDLDADGARASLAHLIESCRAQGADLKFIEAHRQHSDQRGKDPGKAIWREVALPVAREYGLKPTKRTTGSGKRVPRSWSQ